MACSAPILVLNVSKQSNKKNERIENVNKRNIVPVMLSIATWICEKCDCHKYQSNSMYQKPCSNIVITHWNDSLVILLENNFTVRKAISVLLLQVFIKKWEV